MWQKKKIMWDLSTRHVLVWIKQYHKEIVGWRAFRPTTNQTKVDTAEHILYRGWKYCTFGAKSFWICNQRFPKVKISIWFPSHSSLADYLAQVMYAKKCPTTFYCIFQLVWVPTTTSQNIRLCFRTFYKTLFS